MKFELRARMGGKTTSLLAWAEAAPEGEHRVIVSPTKQRAMALLWGYRHVCEDAERPVRLERWQFVSMEEMTRRGGVLHFRGGKVVLALDDVDDMLRQLFPFPVEVVTATLGASTCPDCGAHEGDFHNADCPQRAEAPPYGLGRPPPPDGWVAPTCVKCGGVGVWGTDEVWQRLETDPPTYAHVRCL